MERISVHVEKGERVERVERVVETQRGKGDWEVEERWESGQKRGGEREGRREEGRAGDRREMGGGKKERLLGNQN